VFLAFGSDARRIRKRVREGEVYGNVLCRLMSVACFVTCVFFG
jgi:hypothetical protein